MPRPATRSQTQAVICVERIATTDRPLASARSMAYDASGFEMQILTRRSVSARRTCMAGVLAAVLPWSLIAGCDAMSGDGSATSPSNPASSPATPVAVVAGSPATQASAPAQTASGTGGTPAAAPARAGASAGTSAGANAPAMDAGSRDAGSDAGCASAGDVNVGDCALPASRCRDERTLILFENPRCEDGHCAFDRTFMTCPRGTCQNGACQINVTAL